MNALFDLLGQVNARARFSVRERGILVTACVATAGDSYCALAWGRKLAEASDAETAAGVLLGHDTHLSEKESEMARWARLVAVAPNVTSAGDVQNLRDVGWTDAQIFGMTTFVALRLAFATVNDALGAQPDAQFRDLAPEAVRAAVTFGRPIAAE